MASFTGDFNGDRYTDFGLYNKFTGECKIALSNGSTFGDFTTWIKDFGKDDFTPLAGDFNADGLTDLCIFQKTTGTFKVAFSNTKSFKDPATWITGYATDKDPLISDFNNDGLTDIGYWNKDTGEWFYALNTGSGFTDKGKWLDNFGSSADESAHTGDFDGNGITDPATFDRDGFGINRWTISLSDKLPADLLISIDNGTGGKIQITYDYAAKFNDLTGERSENPLLPFPVYVARSISTIDTLPSDQPQEVYTQTFIFFGGWYDANEKEFRGFRKVIATDPVTNNYTITYFFQGYPGREGDDGALKGQIEKIEAYDGNRKPISIVENTWAVRKAGRSEDILGFPYLKEVTTTVYEENQTSLTTKTLFKYDNLVNIIEQIDQGDISTDNDNKITTTTYEPAYLVGYNRPKETVFKDSQDNILSKKTFEYDEYGNLIKETAYLDGVNDPVTQYRYDSFGNVIATTNALGNVVLTDYETTFYTFPKTVTNELGHTIRYEYNTKLGVVTKLTDVNGNTSETVYDSLGRVIKQINTKGEIVTTYTYPDFNTKITTQLGLTKTEYIDGLGRIYKTVSSAEDGPNKRLVSTEIYFNERGLKEKESIPHYIDESESNISYITYEYDLRGRIISVTSDYPGEDKDATVTTAYISPLYTETTDPKGFKKGVRKDVYGNTIEIIEFAEGEYHTFYEYDLKGNLTKVTDALGNITTIQYDTLGRKTLLNAQTQV